MNPSLHPIAGPIGSRGYCDTSPPKTSLLLSPREADLVRRMAAEWARDEVEEAAFRGNQAQTERRAILDMAYAAGLSVGEADTFLKKLDPEDKL